MSFTRSIELATALQAYQVRSKTDTTSDTNRLIQEAGLRKTSFDKIFPAMFSLHGLDIRDAIDKAVQSKDITKAAAEVAIEAISDAMQDIANRYPVMAAETFKTIDSIVQDFIAAFNESGADKVTKDKLAAMSVHMERLKAMFKQPYIVAYSAGGPNRVASLKIAHNSFSNLRDIVNNRIKDAVSTKLQERGITNSKLKDSTYLTTKIINWGHTQTSSTIITGKLLAEILSAKNFAGIGGSVGKDAVVDIIAKDFLEQTGQEKTVIKVHHGDLTKGEPDVLNLVIESGIFQTVIVQNRRENQEDLGQLEKKWNILDAIGRKNLLGAFGVTSIKSLAVLLLKVKSSPSVLDNIETLFREKLSGQKLLKSTAKTVTLLNSNLPIKKKRKSVTLKNNTASGSLRTDSGATSSAMDPQLDLFALQTFINAHLQDVMSANMGDGSRKDILNYRTGRLASSVKVERMSQSREGMITAFYTYMKNPYATFSEGGQQEYPKTRDPKLLISKSIREIAAEKVSNRLKAVVV